MPTMISKLSRGALVTALVCAILAATAAGADRRPDCASLGEFPMPYKACGGVWVPQARYRALLAAEARAEAHAARKAEAEHRAVEARSLRSALDKKTRSASIAADRIQFWRDAYLVEASEHQKCEADRASVWAGTPGVWTSIGAVAGSAAAGATCALVVDRVCQRP